MNKNTEIKLEEMLKLTELPRLVDHSMSQTNQRFMLLSESEEPENYTQMLSESSVS